MMERPVNTYTLNPKGGGGNPWGDGTGRRRTGHWIYTDRDIEGHSGKDGTLQRLYPTWGYNKYNGDPVRGMGRYQLKAWMEGEEAEEGGYG